MKYSGGIKKIISVCSLILLLYGASSFSVWAATFQCEKDTYIDALYPDDNFGGSDRLLVADSEQPTRALLKFYIPSWVAASNISGCANCAVQRSLDKWRRCGN